MKCVSVPAGFDLGLHHKYLGSIVLLQLALALTVFQSLLYANNNTAFITYFSYRVSASEVILRNQDESSVGRPIRENVANLPLVRLAEKIIRG